MPFPGSSSTMSINDFFSGELLLEVFAHAVHDPTVIRCWNDQVHPPLRTMLGITHVCRRWRYLGLEHSTLWKGCVDIGRPIECTKEILLRSGAQPLHLEFFIPVRTRWDPVIRFYTTHPAPEVLDNPYRDLILSRTRSLRAVLPLTAVGCDKAFNYFKPHLPQMETIFLQFDSWSVRIQHDDLFDDKEWMVRVLSLKKCSIKLQPKALPFLEELRVEYPSAWAFPDLDTWVDLLAGLPQLRVFELVECFGPSDTAPSRASPNKKIHMGKLERLVLNTSQPLQQIIAPLLDALVLPPTCALTVGAPIRHSAPSYKALLSVLSKRYGAYDNALGDNLDLTITDNAFAMQTRGPSAPAETFIYFYFRGGCRHTALRNHNCALTNAGVVFQTVLEAFRKPVSSIQWLTLRTYVHKDKQINPFFNLRLLRKFTNLQSIDLNLESIFGGFPPMDSPSTFTPGPSDPRMFWFPSAAHQELVIMRFDFSEETSLHTLCLELMQHLKPQGRRWNPESRIQTLSLMQCTGLRNWELAKLEELIGLKYEVDIRCMDCEVLDVY